MKDIYRDKENFVKYTSFVYRYQGIAVSACLRLEDISDVISIILVCIYRNPGDTQNEIAFKCALDKSVVSKKITELEKNGYVVRKINEKNRKYYNIYLTDKGNELVQRSLKIQQEIWDDIFDKSNVTPEEIKQAADIMMKISNAIMNSKL